MKYSKITFRRKYNLGNYSNEEIDIEVELEDSDDLQEAINAARKEVDANHTANNPQLYQVEKSCAINNYGIPMYPSTEDTIIKEPPPEPLTREARILQQINEVTDIKILESFKLIVKKNADLQSAYDLKLQSLQKQTA